MSSIEFSARKQTELFDLLKQRQFSGQLLLADSKQRRWTFYLSAGRIIYVSGGIHPTRRWQRNLALAASHIPEIPTHPSIWQRVLEKNAPESLRFGWEYQLLCFWVDRQELTFEEATKTIWFDLVEVLFDLNQVGEVSFKLREDKLLSARLVAIEAQDAIAIAEKLWLAWQAASATAYSPHMALAIEHPEKLRQYFSDRQYQSLIELGNGQNTLHDLAVRLKREVVTIIRLFLPYIASDLMKLIDIPDLPPPVCLPMSPQFVSSATPTQQPLIACVDDSPLIGYFMETIVKQTNCRFIAIDDSQQAIKILSNCQPDLIFLDLVMPKADGYEICTQLRKLPMFRRTPIVILTGNDGIIDRVKAKLVGASGFINKPVKSEIVIGILRKYFKTIVGQSLFDPDDEVKYRGRPVRQ
ncbi:response regulator [Hydrococcus rivularis NIES-593]|uniref:Response regulator n=1 Tax=Hydrococcus rivularis NIES-593 TaxID=1921803 RepID=A0A1U7H8B3_9CYAN|nr:response regulator [Hydrococcus rivularis]OKH19162.1 response regulator [Hydrococcus rivularis NIES-593]